MSYSVSNLKLIAVGIITVLFLVTLTVIYNVHGKSVAAVQCGDERKQCLEACFGYVNVSSIFNNGTVEYNITDLDVMEAEDTNSSLLTCMEKCPDSDACPPSVNELIGNDTVVMQYVSETEKYITEDGHFDLKGAQKDNASSEILFIGENFESIAEEDAEGVKVQGIPIKWYGRWWDPIMEVVNR
jgi:hypothetical protein